MWSAYDLLVRDRARSLRTSSKRCSLEGGAYPEGGKYNEEGKFLPWVMRIAHNLVIDHFRRNKKMPMVRSNDDHDVFATIAQPGKNVEQRMVNLQIDEDVRKLIDHLPDEQREVVVMRTYLGIVNFRSRSLTRRT